MIQPTPEWRREPYRILFPVGLALTWAGIMHWLLHAVGLLPDYRPVFHAIAQIQGFMTCFAVGFLFTAIPRRTGTAPPLAWQIAAGAFLPLATTFAAWYQNWALSQIFWLALVVVLLIFILQRVGKSQASRRPPHSFIWIPVSFAMGVAGSIMTSALGVLGPDFHWLHNLGQIVLLQGMFLGLVVGVGGMVLPLITCGDAPADTGSTSRDRWIRAGHLTAAFLLLLSFWIENEISLRGGYLLRFLVLLVLLLAVGRIWRWPRQPGWHRRLVWLSAWLIPVGYLLAALFPAEKKAGLHVVFIGGFALMAFSVGIHVTLAHGGYRSLLHGRPWQVPLLGGSLVAAMVMRALVDFDQARFFLWLGASAALLLLSSLFWAFMVLPRLVPQDPEA